MPIFYIPFDVTAAFHRGHYYMYLDKFKIKIYCRLTLPANLPMIRKLKQWREEGRDKIKRGVVKPRFTYL